MSTARKADPRARGRATFATGEREASPGSDRGVRAWTGADGFTAAAILQVKGPESQECISHYNNISTLMLCYFICPLHYFLLHYIYITAILLQIKI